MNAQRKEAPAAKTAASKLVKSFRLDGVSASIFANDRQVQGEARTFYNVAVSRTYMKDGEYKRSHSFGTEDLGKLLYVVKQAGDFIESLPSVPAEALPD